MAYTSFDATKPDPSTENGTSFGTSIRNNQEALRDAIVIGAMEDWNLSTSGTAPEWDFYLFSKAAERLKITLTWGTTGGEDGNVTQAVYAYSSNSGGSYDTIGTLAITYDANAYVTATTWS